MVAAALVLAVAVSAYWWLPLALRPMVFFGVRRVQVAGARYLAPETVVQAMGLRAGANVFDDLRVLERRVEGMGGITQVKVRRRLPATLLVEVVEEEPVALAQGPDGLVPLAKDGRPLPYDVARGPVDAPIVESGDRALLEALNRIQITDLGLYADVVAARARGGEVLLDLTQGRVRLDLPVDPEIVRSISAVRGDLAGRAIAWRELDGRFGKWVVVRKDEPRARGRTAAPERRPRKPAHPAVRSSRPA
jgi:hypothetical protein